MKRRPQERVKMKVLLAPEAVGNTVMNVAVWFIYLAFIIGGFIWIGVRVQQFIRSQSESESNWDRLLNDEEFKQYLKKLKQEKAAQAESDSVQSESGTRSHPGGS